MKYFYLVSDLQNVADFLLSTDENQEESSRRVRSGPKERTQSLASDERITFDPVLSEGHPITAKKFR